MWILVLGRISLIIGVVDIRPINPSDYLGLTAYPGRPQPELPVVPGHEVHLLPQMNSVYKPCIDFGPAQPFNHLIKLLCYPLIRKQLCVTGIW